MGIRTFRKICQTPNVAVFDTSFHTTMPKTNYMYAILTNTTKNTVLVNMVPTELATVTFPAGQQPCASR